MSVTTEDKPLVGANSTEIFSDRNTTKKFDFTTETTSLFPSDPPDSELQKNTFKNTLGRLIQPKFRQPEEKSPSKENNFKGSLSELDNDKKGTMSLTSADKIPIPKDEPDSLVIDNLSPIKRDPEHIKQQVSRNLLQKPTVKKNAWRSLLNLDEPKAKSISANVSGSSTPKSSKVAKVDKIRRKSTQDCRNLIQEMQKEEENGKSSSKKPGSNFTLEHFSLLRKQIENEKQRLAEDIKEAVEEKEKKESVLSLSETSSRKWEKAKTNVLALARLKRLKDDLRLWGSNMHMTGQTPEQKNLKMLIPENQFDNNAPQKKNKRFMIYPQNTQNKFYSAWQTIYGLCMLYTAFITPYRIGFLIDLPLWWVIFEQVIDVLFLCDVIITLNTALVLENGQIIDSRRAIFLNYLKGWLIMDIVAIVPYSLFMESADGNGNDYSDLVKFVRLPRLYKVVRFAKVFKVMKRIKRNKYFQNIQDSLKINISTLRMINFLLILLLSVHVFACLWFFAAKFYRFTPGTWVYELGLLDESNVSLYITSVYWVVSTLTTVGFGDVHAFNDFERLLSIFWIVIGVGFYSLNIGAMTSLLANKDTREGNLAAKLVLMDEFAKETNLPKELRLKIKRALEYNSLRNVFNQFERNEFFDEIPIDVKSEMAEVMHRGVITKLKFFKNKDRVFIATMVPLLQPLKVTKGELIYRTGEYPINIYFIISGRVNIVVGAHMLNLKTYVQGSYFGEIEMVNNTIRQSTIRAEMDCELLTLSRKAFLRLMEDFPNYHDELKLIAEERQLRIAEALRKIKQLLPIASTSKFWEKKRQHSLYDLDEVNRIQEFGSNDKIDEKPFSMKQAGRLIKQQTLKFAKAKNHLGPKIDEEENEDDDEDARVSIPRQILEDREVKGKIANLINAEELKEEENKIAKMISQMQNSRASPDGNKLVNDQNSQLTQTQLNTKLMQAEGDSKKKKAVLIVKGTSNNPKPITAVENIKPVNNPVVNAAIQAKRHSHSFSASVDKSFHSNTSNSPVHEGDKKTINRKSYLFRRSQNFESVMPMRRSITAKAKVNKIVPKPKTGLFNRIFDSQKTESKKKNPSLEDFEGKPEEKIDILEIPAKVIRNFNKNARSNSLEKATSNPRNNEASDPQFLKIKSTPNMGFPDNRPPEDKLENSIALDPNLCDSGEESSNPGSKPKRNNYDETPKKVLMVSGTNFERKKNRTNTATSLTSNEEDEIPDIAMCLVGPGEINKNFRLNIYDAPNNKFNTEKAFSNFWGSSSPKGRDEKAIDNNQAELLRRRRDDLQDYKINIIAPKSSSKLEDSGLIQKDKISPDVSRDGSSSQRGKTPAEEGISKTESNKLQLSYDLQRKNSIEIVKTHASQALNKNRLTSQSSLKLIKTTGSQNLSRQTSLRVLKSEPLQSVAFLKPPVVDKSNSSLDPKSDQATGAIRTDQSLSRLSILSSDLKNSKFLDSFTSQDLNLEGEGHKSVDMDQKDLGLSVIMSEEQQEAQESIRENSMRRSDKTKSLKVDTPRDTDWKNLTPPPIVKDVSWKRSQTAPDQGMEFGEETAKFSEKKVDTAKSLKKSEEKNKERDKARRKEKAEQGNYKEKYKKQKRYIKELLSGFKDLRKDFGGMQKDVGSIQARLDTFETLVGNLQGLIAKFAEKVKDPKKGSKSSRKSPSIERTIENNETENSDVAGGTVVSQNMSPATATVYMPQKKTIVFSFQKPEAKVKKFGKQEGYEKSEKPEIKELQASFRDSSLFYNDDSMPSPIRQKPDEIQMKPVQPENKPKPDMRRIPKLKGTISKAGFQVLNKDKYASDEEGNSFINTNYEDPESKIS